MSLVLNLPPSVSAESTARTLTEANNGATVDAQVGDTVLVRLGVQSGTGYSWRYSGKHKHQVTIEEQKRPDAGTTEARAGMPGEQTFLVKIEGKGKFELDFQYARPWVKSKPAKTFHLELHCR